MAPRGQRRPGDRFQRPRRKVDKTPPAKTHGWRVLFYLIVVGLIVAVAVAARHSSGGSR